MSVYDLPDPSDVPGTRDFAETQADIRRDLEIDDDLYQRVLNTDADRLIGWMIGRAPKVVEQVVGDMERFDQQAIATAMAVARRHPSAYALWADNPEPDNTLREGVAPHLKGTL